MSAFGEAMEYLSRPAPEMPNPKLKDSQAKFLDGMLASIRFTDLCRQLGMTKANGALLVKGLRKVGLVVVKPSVPNRRRVVKELDAAGAVQWWDHPVDEVPEGRRLDPRYTGPGRWAVVALPIPRHERADLEPNRWVVAVTAPWAAVAFIVSDRLRLSYDLVGRELEPVIRAATRAQVDDWATTVRIVTEMVADAMGVQAVLPVAFIRAEEEVDGGEDDPGADDSDGETGDGD